MIGGFMWWTRADSNRRLPHCKCGVLPLNYGPIMAQGRHEMLELLETFQASETILQTK